MLRLSRKERLKELFSISVHGRFFLFVFLAACIIIRGRCFQDNDLIEIFQTINEQHIDDI